MAKEYTVSDSKTGKPEHYQDQDVIETSVNTDGRNQYDWVKTVDITGFFKKFCITIRTINAVGLSQQRFRFLYVHIAKSKGTV